MIVNVRPQRRPGLTALGMKVVDRRFGPIWLRSFGEPQKIGTKAPRIITRFCIVDADVDGSMRAILTCRLA